MADRVFLVDLDLSGNQIKRMRVENLAEDPSGEDLYGGRLWFNTTSNLLKVFAGGVVVSLGSGGGGAPAAHASSHATGGDDPITPASIGAATVGELADAANAAAAAAQAAEDAAVLATAAQGTADNAVTAAGIAQTTADNAASAATAAQTTANAALPKPGGTTTANGIAYGTGTSGAAVAISTTTIADLVKRLGNVFTLNANTVLDDSYSGSVIFVDTTLGARTLTIPPTLAAGWNAVIVREGANTLNIVGSTVGADTMLMKGPAAAANAVAIAVDDGGVSVIRRSATKCWCAGKVS